MTNLRSTHRVLVPDITGSGLGVNDTTCNSCGGLKGAFYSVGTGSGKGNGSWGSINIGFAASRADNLFGQVSTVQSPAIQTLMIIKV